MQIVYLIFLMKIITCGGCTVFYSEYGESFADTNDQRRHGKLFNAFSGSLLSQTMILDLKKKFFLCVCIRSCVTGIMVELTTRLAVLVE